MASSYMSNLKRQALFLFIFNICNEQKPLCCNEQKPKTHQVFDVFLSNMISYSAIFPHFSLTVGCKVPSISIGTVKTELLCWLWIQDICKYAHISEWGEP